MALSHNLAVVSFLKGGACSGIAFILPLGAQYDALHIVAPSKYLLNKWKH